MDKPTFWMVLYVRPRTEKKVNENLKDAGINTWCPMHKVSKQWSDRTKIVEEPIFRSYVFVNIKKEDTEKPKSINGVLNYVYSERKIAIVRDEEIEVIKKYLKHDGSVVTLHDASTFKTNDKVRVANGVFMSKCGKVTRVGKKRIFVQIESLGTVLSIEFNTQDVELI